VKAERRPGRRRDGKNGNRPQSTTPASWFTRFYGVPDHLRAEREWLIVNHQELAGLDDAELRDESSRLRPRELRDSRPPPWLRLRRAATDGEMAARPPARREEVRR
jgi:hypothetical protein